MRRFSLAAKALLAVVAALVGGVVFAAAASAHVGTISISCTAVTFNYTSFQSTGAAIAETVSINGTQVVSKTFDLTGASGSDLITISGATGDTVTANAMWSVDGGGSATSTQTLSGCSPPCPPGIHPNFRWHYSANGSSGSWSGTATKTCPGSVGMGPQAMEGNLRVAPGTTLLAGYDFTIPGNHSSLTITVSNAQWVFAVSCVSGATPSASTFTVTAPTQTYQVTNDQWYPSGDQSSPLVYQGSISVPNLCGGGDLDLAHGATFSATLS
jgi:hypothetical protein